jgi:ribosomal protein S18 acetylase RimI-like enzyme
LIKLHDLTAEDLAHAGKLLALCNVFEGLDLPLNLEPGRPEDPGNQFIFSQGEAPAGVLTLQVGLEIEVCLAVHPGHRRRGIGRALLRAAATECGRRGTGPLVLVCDNASQSGKAFAAAVGAVYRNTESRMRLDQAQWRAGARPGPPVELERATADHAGVLAYLIGTAFGHPVDQERARVTRDLSQPTHRFFVARAGGETVGTVGVVTADDRCYIIALGVLPAHRGKGYARSLLQTVVGTLVEEGHREVFIEVDTENRGAMSLYRSSGFRETSRYSFYRVPAL